MRIALDAMGGDHAPRAIVEGAALARRRWGIAAVLVGPREVLCAELQRLGVELEVVDAPEVVQMGDPPLLVRKRPRSSIAVAFELLRRGEVQAVVGAGNSGAMVLGAMMSLEKLPGVDRPAIAALLPTARGSAVLIDAGANVNCKPVNLVQFAIMGAHYARTMLGCERPRVALLSNGTEPGKGNGLVRAADALLRATSLEYVGYAEGREVYGGAVDVLVSDGFAGNVFLKASEAMAESLGSLLRAEAHRSWRARVGYLLMRPAVEGVYRRVDYAEHGGALLLGLSRPVVIAHGSSSPQAVANAVRVAHDLLQRRVVEEMAHALSADGDLSRAASRSLWSRFKEWKHGLFPHRGAADH